MKSLYRLLLVLASASFFYASAQAQNAGTVTNHAVPIGKGPGVTGFGSALGTNNKALMGVTGADPTFRSLVGADLPTPTGSTLGGVQSLTCSSNNWFNTLSTSGVFGCAQPAFSNLSGNIAVSQMNSGTSASATTMWRGDATWVAPQAMPYTPANGTPSSQTMQAQLQKIPVSCEDYSGGCTTANIQAAMTYAAANQRCFQFNGTYTTTTTVSLSAITSNLCLTGRGGLKGPASGTITAVLEIKNFTGMTVDGNITIDCNSNAFIGAGLKVWSSSAGLSVQYQSIGFSTYANCRQAIQIGDPTQSTLPISEINIPTGYLFNVAQGVRAWSSNAVVTVQGLISTVDAHSSGNWALSATGTCTSTTITLSAPTANSYFDQYDIITGTNIVAGTYITGQASGTLGGAGVYNLSTSGNTCVAVAVSGEKRAINYWATGASINVSGAETANTVTNNGLLCLIDVMAGPNIYGNCSFTGGVLEMGGQAAASFNPTAIASPTAGVISFVSNRGFVGGLTTTNLITTDSTYAGSIVITGNHQLFATSLRTGLNIVAASASTLIYHDAASFGVNMVKGASGVSGGTSYMYSHANTATSLQAAPSNPTGTTSAVGVMMGMGGTCKITPASTGRVQVTFVGQQTDTAAYQHTVNARYGTGVAPANGAALTGTTVLGNSPIQSGAAATPINLLNLSGIINGMTIGTAYWFDMQLATGSGGTGSLANMNCTIVEF